MNSILDPIIMISLVQRKGLLMLLCQVLELWMIFFQLRMDWMVTYIFPTQHLLLLPPPEAHHEPILHVQRGTQFGLNHLATAIWLTAERKLLQGNKQVKKAPSRTLIHMCRQKAVGGGNIVRTVASAGGVGRRQQRPRPDRAVHWVAYVST